MAAAVGVAILVLAVWIGRRSSPRKNEDSSFPWPFKTAPNAPDADSSTSELADASGSTNTVHGDAPPPDGTVSTSSDHSAFGKRIPVPTVSPAASVESTRPVASAERGHMSELASGDQVTLDTDHTKTTLTVEGSAPFSAVNIGLSLHDPTADQDPTKTSKPTTKDVAGLADNNSDGASSLHLGIGAAEAVMEAAMAVASSSSIPGVVETAKLVSLLVNLVVDHNSNEDAVDRRVRWCRSIVSILERASELLGKVKIRNRRDANNDHEA